MMVLWIYYQDNTHQVTFTWFRGSEKGFLPGEELDEIYKVKAKKNRYSLPFTNPDGNNYWQYSSAAFGDFDNDGDQDMVVGGGALRISKNIGTKFKPLFGKREELLDVNGNPLKNCDMPEEKLLGRAKMDRLGRAKMGRLGRAKMDRLGRAKMGRLGRAKMDRLGRAKMDRL